MESAEVTSTVEDDTVYTTIKADLKQFEDAENEVIKIPFSLDITSLGINQESDIAVWSGLNETWTNGKADTDSELYLIIRFNNNNSKDNEDGKSSYAKLKSGESTTKEFIVKVGKHNNGGTMDRDAALKEASEGKYIRYVFTLENL